MSCVQLPEGGFQVVYLLGLWSWSSLITAPPPLPTPKPPADYPPP